MKTNQKQKSITWILFIVYLAALSWIILFKLSFSIAELEHVRSLNLIPFGGSMLISGQADVSEIIMNAVIFLPFGIYISMVYPKSKVGFRFVVIAAASLLLEAMQFIFAIGRSDITDLIGNSLGGILGILVYALLCAAFKREEKAYKFFQICAMITTSGMILFLGMLVVVNL